MWQHRMTPTLREAKAMEEIRPTVFHWTTIHERHRMSISSYYWEGPEGGVVIDPRVPDEGLGWFEGHAQPANVYLTNRHHYRQTAEFVAAFGAAVWCEQSGLQEFTRGETVTGFAFESRLPGGGVAHEVGSICPEETAIHLPEAGAVAFADGLVRHPFDGDLAFVPDFLLGDDPAEVKRGLLAAFRRLLDLEFDTVLLAHGSPLVGDGKRRLATFVAAREGSL
jgi:hypothetical protein